MALAYKVRSEEEIRNIQIPTKDDPSFASPMAEFCGRLFFKEEVYYSPIAGCLRIISSNYGNYTFNKFWLVKGRFDWDTLEFIPAPESEQGYDLSMYVRNRQEWVPEPQPVIIMDTVIDLIKKASEICDIEVLESFSSQGHYYREYEIAYDFTWVDFAESNRGRISGISFNKLQKKTWESSQAAWSTEEQLAGRYYNECRCYPPVTDYRAEHGTYIKPSKLIRALLPELTESEVTTISSAFSNLLRIRANPDTEAIQISDKPSEIYTLSSRFDSCMRRQDPCRFQIYDDLPETRIAYILNEEGDLIGRALIHDCVCVTNSDNAELVAEGDIIKVMDRIYSNNSDTEAIFKSWAIKNGYWYKTHQALGVYTFYGPTSGEKSVRIYGFIACAEKLENKYEEVPYIDTFHRYCEGAECAYLSTDQIEMSDYPEKYICYLQSTDGEDSENYIVTAGICRHECECCGDRYREDDMTRVDYDGWYCESCYADNFSYCEHCDSMARSDSFTRVAGDTYVCERCLDEDYLWCEGCQEYCYQEEVDEFDGRWLCTSCYEEAEAEADEDEEAEAEADEDEEAEAEAEVDEDEDEEAEADEDEDEDEEAEADDLEPEPPVNSEVSEINNWTSVVSECESYQYFMINFLTEPISEATVSEITPPRLI